GVDKGWRGGLGLSLSFSGTPADLDVKADASLQDFRRYDIVSTESVKAGTQCTAHYSSIDHMLSEIACLTPAGEGYMALRGSIASPSGRRVYNLSVSSKDVPMQSLLTLLLRAKKDLPADLTAKGTLNGEVKIRSRAAPDEPGVEWDG